MPTKSPLTSTPCRVDVPWGKRPPRGVLWASGPLLDFHAYPERYVRSMGRVMPPRPARLDEFRALVLGELGRLGQTQNWSYYACRRLACPFRCALDSTSCPVDVLIELLSKRYRLRVAPPTAT
jgi:hypothetical protein